METKKLTFVFVNVEFVGGHDSAKSLLEWVSEKTGRRHIGDDNSSKDLAEVENVDISWESGNWKM